MATWTLSWSVPRITLFSINFHWRWQYPVLKSIPRYWQQVIGEWDFAFHNDKQHPITLIPRLYQLREKLDVESVYPWPKMQVSQFSLCPSYFLCFVVLSCILVSLISMSMEMRLLTEPGLLYAVQTPEAVHSLVRSAGYLELCIFRWMFRSVLNFESADFHLLLRNNHTRFVDGSWGNSWTCCHDTLSLELESFLRPRTIPWMSRYWIEFPLTVASTSFVNVLSSALNDSSSLDASKISWICCIDQDVSDVRGRDDNVVSMVRLFCEWVRGRKLVLVWRNEPSSLYVLSGAKLLHWFKFTLVKGFCTRIYPTKSKSCWRHIHLLRSTRVGTVNTFERKVPVTSRPSRFCLLKISDVCGCDLH